MSSIFHIQKDRVLKKNLQDLADSIRKDGRLPEGPYFPCRAI